MNDESLSRARYLCARPFERCLVVAGLSAIEQTKYAAVTVLLSS